MKLAFLQLPAEERRLYIEQAATRRNVSPVIMEKKTGPPTFPWPTTGPTSLRSFLSGIARDGLDGAAPDGRNGSAANVLRPDQRIAEMVGGPEERPGGPERLEQAFRHPTAVAMWLPTLGCRR